MRIIKTGVALALLLGVSAANAAGLGKLTVNSALGQPLNAEIDLVSVQPGELDALSARVAPPEAFREARIEYSSALRLLRFSVDKRANGQPFLKVTSVAAINEPFVDLLVEVTWPAGRIQREYPILLDPPGYAQGRTAPPTVAAAPAAQAPTSPPASAPAESSQPPASAPASPAPSAPISSAPAPADTGAPSARAELGGPSGLPTESAGDTYGPVERGDTLRKIAEQTKPANVSLEQMLVALYRENKSAFVNNNMNRLKTGQILKVPAAEEVEKLERREVNREIRTHVADWKAYREQLASGVASTPASSGSSSNVASGTIGSAAVAPAPTPGPSGSQDVLKLSKTDSGKAGATKGGGAATQERLNALQEELTAKTKALGEANSRVAELEKQIRDMQRLLDLKGGAPGKADSKVAAAPPPPVIAPAKPAEPPKAVEPVVKPGDLPKADTKLAEAGKTDTTSTPPTTTPTPSEPPKVAEAPKTTESPPKTADAAKPAPPKTADATKPAPKKPAPPPPGLVDQVMDNPAYLAAGVGGLALLGLGAFMFVRRRRQNAEVEASSQMGSAFPSDLKAPPTGGKPAAGLVDTGNSSFLTDFDKTGPGSIDTDEVDPVAEAEVYIAYGRDAQAEEILKEAMARDRGRHEIALKLLEIYHARKSATAFENVAKELKGAVGENHPMWQKAAAMGAQIDPSNPLYGAAAGGTATYTAMSPSAPAPQQARPDLDFDLEGSSSGSSSSAPAPDFDLDLDSKKSEQSGSNVDFDLAPSGQTMDMPAEAESPKEEKPAFDFDLSGLDFPGSKPAGSSAPAASSSSSSMDLADLNLDSPPSGGGGGGGGGGEAVGTKLELAKAYLEIGDKDGAREILQEVAKEGSSAQQEEAKRLISSL